MSQVPNPFNAYREPLAYESRADSITVAQFFNTVYAWMATGLALTAVVAYFIFSNRIAMMTVFQPGVLLVIVLAELALVWVLSSTIQKLSATTATVLFLVYSALNGLMLSGIFVAYKMPTIVGAFVVTAGTFGAMSVYGFVTKRDLSGLGSMLFMALIGLIIASFVNLFWANSTLYWIVTYAGVLIFVGLTAYDTQYLKQIAMQVSHDKEMANRLAIYGALKLYLDFINLFLFILRILGSRRN